jgi:hypothetical protein
MKKKLILFTLLITSFVIKAQDCNYEKNEMDKATNKLTKITKKKTVCDNPFVSAGKMGTQKVGDSCSVNWKYDGGFGGAAFIVNRNAELIFTLVDGTIVKLLRGPEKDNYPITKEQMDAMMKSKTSLIQYYYTEVKSGDYDKQSYIIAEKNGDKIMELIKCIY